MANALYFEDAVDQVSKLRQQLLAMIETNDSDRRSFGFKEASTLLTIIFDGIAEIIQTPHPLRAVEPLTAAQERITLLCAEGIKAELQVQSLLRVSLSLLQTIEIQRAALDSGESGISPSKLDEWLSKQITDLDPDNDQAI